jgi:group II intron reverse transcriptase/maturase
MSLFNTLCQFDTLLSAWEAVKTKKSTGGVDDVSIEQFAEKYNDNIDKLHNELIQERYKPQPYERIQIPKDEGEWRNLGMLSVRDKVVQVALKNLIEPIVSTQFLGSSYGYREGKGPTKAIGFVKHLIEYQHLHWLAKCDIDSCFDNIPHDKVLAVLAKHITEPKIVHLVELCLKMGYVNGRGEWIQTNKGIPQGAVLSPLLSNLYLHPIDVAMAQKPTWGYCRYADDFLMICPTQVEAHVAIDFARNIVEKQLGMALNPGVRVANVNTGFTFLGIQFRGSNIELSADKTNDLKEKISRTARLTATGPSPKLVETLNGIRHYYCKLVAQAQIEVLDQHLCQQLGLFLSRHKTDFPNEATRLAALQGLVFLSTKYQNEAQKQREAITKKVPEIRKKEPKKALSEADKLVKQRKREYQKREADGFELLISKPGLVLGISKKGITVKENGINLNEGPTQNVRSISVLSAGVSVSSNLVEHCADNHIGLTFYGSDGKPYAKLTPEHDTSATLWQAQLLATNSPKAAHIAKQMVRGKIHNAMSLLKYSLKYFKQKYPDLVKNFEYKLNKISELADQIRPLPETDLDQLREQLMGIEGRAAAIYWELFRELVVDESIDFKIRVHQHARDIVNCALNYGYGILYGRRPSKLASILI